MNRSYAHWTQLIFWLGYCSLILVLVWSDWGGRQDLAILQDRIAEVTRRTPSRERIRTERSELEARAKAAGWQLDRPTAQEQAKRLDAALQSIQVPGSAVLARAIVPGPRPSLRFEIALNEAGLTAFLDWVASHPELRFDLVQITSAENSTPGAPIRVTAVCALRMTEQS